MNLYLLFVVTNALFISGLFCMALDIDERLILLVNGSIQVVLLLIYSLQGIIYNIIIKFRKKKDKELNDFEVEGK